MLLIRVALLAIFAVTLTSVSVYAQQATNVAMTATAEASSVHPHGHVAARAIDGLIDDGHRWVSDDDQGPHILTLTLSAEFEIAGAHLYSGYQSGSPAKDFELEYWDGQAWQAIPGARIRDNSETLLAIPFGLAVSTTRVRFISHDNRVRVKELAIWLQDDAGLPPLGTGVEGGPPTPPDQTRHYALANQCGFDTHGPKRFTAPLSPDGSTFTVRRVRDDAVMFEGLTRDGVGDFSQFTPPTSDDEYFIRVQGESLSPGDSFPFAISPHHMERMCLDPALRFMVDARSIVGTHPSAYGGTPWRDGTFYTYEMPSLVLMYLANPAYFEQAQVEIDWEADKARVMDPGFNWVRATVDRDVLDATRRYFTELDAPVGDSVPDLIQIIHWTLGMYLMDPATVDSSGGGDGDIIHSQTVEQFAYFLYAYPYMDEYFSDGFYESAEGFAFDQWELVGLFDVITKVGFGKGRHAPGHSIMPNLMMYEVALREGRPDADRFLEAAIAQARWVIETFEPTDARVGKGQRMSEHKTITGLTMLQRMYPRHAPRGLERWLRGWQNGIVAASDNLYDFRRYSDTAWTLPKPWNEPGNIAGLPGLIDAVSMAVGPGRHEERLQAIGVAHIDNLFGRNPLNATSSHRGAVDFPGIDRVWPKEFHHDVCARLELCRGTLSSNAASEHYPFSPQNGFRHCEGWTPFNAAWNVTLAYRCRALTRISFSNIDGDIPVCDLAVDTTANLVIHALADVDPDIQEILDIWVRVGDTSRVVRVAQHESAGQLFLARVTPATLGLIPGQDADIGYGYGFMATTRKLIWSEQTESWQIQQSQ